jgi:hypothetical protein
VHLALVLAANRIKSKFNKQDDSVLGESNGLTGRMYAVVVAYLTEKKETTKQSVSIGIMWTC